MIATAHTPRGQTTEISCACIYTPVDRTSPSARRALALIRNLDDEIFGDEYVPYAPLEGAWWFIANVDNQVVGFGGIKRINKYSADLCRGGVRAAFRGRGVHRALIQSRITWARNMGLRSVSSQIRIDNTPSLVNHLACGFIIDDQSRSHMYFKRSL